MVEGFISGQPVAYVLFGIGAMITVVLEMLGLSSMVFALGIYLPLQLTTPILAGGFLAPGEQARRQDGRGAWPQHSRARRHRGRRPDGGRSAGRRFGAGLRLFPKFSEDMVHTPFYANQPVSQMVSAVMFIGLCLYVWFSSVKGKEAA